MATSKQAAVSEANVGDKRHLVSFTKDLSMDEKIAALKAVMKELEIGVLDELHAQKKGLETQLKEVNAKIETITGPSYSHPASRGSKGKHEGIKVSVSALADRIKAAKDGVLNIRNEKLDLASVRKAVDESGGKFKMGGKSPWPTVSLA